MRVRLRQSHSQASSHCVTFTSSHRRVAVVLHGRIGIWKTKATHIDNPRVVWLANAPEYWKQAPADMTGIDVTPHSTLAGFAAFGRASLWHYVVEPNRNAGLTLDLFLHSWHAEIGGQLDAMYKPVASKHERVRERLDPVRSQHLSMKTGLTLMTAHELRPGGAPYDLTLVARYDILYFTPLLLRPLGAAPLWLAHWCHRYDLSAQAGMLVRSACGNWPGHGEGYLVVPARSVGMAPSLKRSRQLTRDADYDFAYLDWWFVATPVLARTFGDIYDKYYEYAAALKRIADFPLWSHFFWGYHINRRLRLRRTVRHIFYEGVDFRLARHWNFGTHCMSYLGAHPTEPVAAAAQTEAEAAEAAAILAITTRGPTAAATIATAAAATTTAAAAAAAALRAVPGGALAAVANAGVDLSVFYRRRPKNTRAHYDGAGAGAAPVGSSSGGGGGGGNETRQVAQLARQCPFDPRVRLYCPWHSAVCPTSMRAAVFDAEAAAQAALNATSKLPRRSLWDYYGEAKDARAADQPPPHTSGRA